MNTKKQAFSSTILVFALFFAYTIGALLLSIIGANVYTKTVEASQENYDARTSVVYLSQKIRLSEQADAISIQTFNNTDALVITESYGEYDFSTWIYIEDGYLCEALLSSNVDLIPGMGQKIMPLTSMDFTLDDNGLLDITVMTEGENTYHSKIYLECM